MTADRLTELLEETSADISPPSLAETAWSTAAAVRRRRRTFTALTAAAALVTVLVAVPWQRSEPPPPPLPAASPEIVAPGVDAVPKTLVPGPVAPLPGSWDIPADAPVLSAHPVDRAVLVAQERDWEVEGAPMLPLHVLDTAGRWFRIDVGDLTRTHDVGGNEADPLRPASLSPDGRRVAVPQPQAVVVIDLTTAKVHRVAVPGLNEQVMWWGDDEVLVEGDGAGLTRVRWATGATTREQAGISAWRSAGSRVADVLMPELDSRDGRLTLRLWRPGSAVPVAQTPVDDGGLPGGYHVAEWYGAGVHNGAGLIVSAAWGDRPFNSHGPGMQGGAEMLTVIDTADASIRRVLDLGVIGQRMKMCCTPLTWLDESTVLVQTDLEGLITWDVRSGVVRQVTTGPIHARLSVSLA